MSLRNTITAGVNSAFSAAGDLVSTGTLIGKSVSGYNFGTAATASTTTPLTVKVILIDRRVPVTGARITEAILKSGPDVSVYDELQVNGKVYNISDYSDNGFTITLDLARENT